MKNPFSKIWESTNKTCDGIISPYQITANKVPIINTLNAKNTYPTWTYATGTAPIIDFEKAKIEILEKKKREIKKKLEILLLAFSNKLENDAGFTNYDAKLLSENFIELL